MFLAAYTSMSTIPPLEQLDPARFDTAPILKKLASASRHLAELKGVAATIPNQGILINMVVYKCFCKLAPAPFQATG